MTGRTISNTITTSLTLGNPGYASPLTITNTGAVIAPGASVAGPAIYLETTGSVLNYGQVTGGGGTADGGPGIFMDAGYFLNAGKINAGANQGNDGAVGVLIAGGSLTNTGQLTGGSGLDYGGAGLGAVGGYVKNLGTIAGKYCSIVGGYGAILTSYNSYDVTTHSYVEIAGTLANHKVVLGGGGGDVGGAGIVLDGGSLFGNGTIQGGNGGNAGGDGVFIQEASFTNTGIVLAGHGSLLGGTGLAVRDAEVTNSGTVAGGYGTRTAGDGASVSFYTTYNATTHMIQSIGAGTLVNESLVTGGGGNGTGGTGVNLTFGVVVNYGTIQGGAGGVVGGTGVYIDTGYLTNTGLIAGGRGGTGGGTGISIRVGTVENAGTIAGGYAGGTGALVGFYTSYNATLHVEQTIGAMLLNDSLVEGGSGGVGVSLVFGELTNNGTVAGGVYGEGGTITNAGLIEASHDAVSFATASRYSYASRLIVDPGAAFSGVVHGSNTPLELAAGTNAATGTLDMGGSFSGFDSIAFDNSAAWAVFGDSAELAAGQTITGFDSADVLGLSGFTATAHSYVSGTGLEISNGTTTETLDITGVSASAFVVTDQPYGTEIQLCYLRGTRILTPAGEIPVESLNIGDAVITRFNGYRKIKWIGRQSFSGRFVQGNRAQIPVRIAAGALGAGLPKRDLSISPGHSMLIGDNLILARNLVNGITIRQDEVPEEIHYYQLEFETHDCVRAEGCWSESFCDYGGLRNQFHNAAEFHALYPDHVTPLEHLMCAPRPEAGPALAAALAPSIALATAIARPGPLHGYIDSMDPAGITGWAQDLGNPELPVLLEVLLQGNVQGRVLACDFRSDLAAEGIGRGYCGFTFTAGKMPRGAMSGITIRQAGTTAEIPLGPHAITRRRRA